MKQFLPPPRVSNIEPEDTLIAGKSVDQLNKEVNDLLEKGDRSGAEAYFASSTKIFIEKLTPKPKTEEDPTKKD